MYLLLFELLLFKDKITVTDLDDNFVFFFLASKRKNKMDEIIFHIPYEKMIALRYLLKKEEEHYCSITRTFFFEIMTRHFFERINDLEKILIEENEFNSLKNKK